MFRLEMYPEYTGGFTRWDYEATFAGFEKDISPFLSELDGAGAENAADGILRQAEALLKHRLGRAAKAFDISVFLCVFLCPAAARHGNPAAAEFGRYVAEKWNARFPQQSFDTGSYEDIASGFRDTILGFERTGK